MAQRGKEAQARVIHIKCGNKAFLDLRPKKNQGFHRFAEFLNKSNSLKSQGNIKFFRLFKGASLQILKSVPRRERGTVTDMSGS